MFLLVIQLEKIDLYKNKIKYVVKLVKNPIFLLNYNIFSIEKVNQKLSNSYL